MSEIKQTETEQAYRDDQGPAGASRLRTTAGVFVLIFAVLGVLEFLTLLFSKPPIVPSTPFNGFMNFLLMVGSFGALVTGIVLLAKQRKRGGATPWLAASFNVIGAIGALMIPMPNPVITAMVSVPALVAAALSGLAIRSEKH